METHYKIKIEPNAQSDLRNAIEYYENQQPDLGRKFYEKFDKCLAVLETNPFYQLRYKEKIRCFVIPNFPYMIHFYINKNHKMVHIVAIISTHPNPETSYL